MGDCPLCHREYGRDDASHDLYQTTVVGASYWDDTEPEVKKIEIRICAECFEALVGDNKEHACMELVGWVDMESADCVSNLARWHRGENKDLPVDPLKDFLGFLASILGDTVYWSDELGVGLARALSVYMGDQKK